jgi:signal transduction histidine kinase
MSGVFLLDWAALAVSLFNTVLFGWLGLTVLLNAARRSWGIGLASGGMLLAGLFFLSHTIILSLGGDVLDRSVNIWWHAAWIPALLTPPAWYVAMLWYAGYWDRPDSPVRRRHRPGLAAVAGLGLLTGLQLFIANPLPDFSLTGQLKFASTPSLFGVPLLVWSYGIYILACIGLSIDALTHPGPTFQAAGQQARERARPWFTAASLALLGVSLLVAAAMQWILLNAGRGLFSGRTALGVTVFDLVIECLIAISTLLTGQAVVRYEIFTGRSLPRRGLRRDWRRAVILAGGYGAAVGLALRLPLPAVYGILLSLTLMTVFYALLSWRSFNERESVMHELRSFLSGPRLVSQILASGKPRPASAAAGAFEAVCREVLGAERAALLPAGANAALFGLPLTHPAEIEPPAAADLPAAPAPGPVIGLAIRWGDAGIPALAIPLWNGPEPAGILVLGPRLDGGLYSQEEIEIAALAGERLIDQQISAELARRLIGLQRSRLGEQRLLDQRARRVLHDEVLPLLHAALLAVGGASGTDHSSAADLLTDAHRQVAALLRAAPGAGLDGAPGELARLGPAEALRRVVEIDLNGSFGVVNWEMSAEAVARMQALPPIPAEVVYYAAREALRNAARHAGTQPYLTVRAEWGTGLTLNIEDRPRPSLDIPADQPSVRGGSGQGLALHSAMLAVFGGSIALEGNLDEGGATRIHLPASAWESEL